MELPKRLEPIDIGETEESKRDAIVKCNAMHVYIKDEHLGRNYVLGEIGILAMNDGSSNLDSQRYSLMTSGGEEISWFNDLEGLLVPKN